MNRNSRNQNANDSQDLDWLAFLYLSDDLSTEKRAQFESRLESDPLAQQALVDSMEQSQILYAAIESCGSSSESRTVELASSTHQSADRKTRRPFMKRPGVLLAAAAALLIAVTGWSMLPDSNSNSDVADSNLTAPAELAVAWAETLQDKELMSLNIADDLFEDEDETQAIDFEVSNGDWMFVALSDLEESGDLD